MQHFKVTQSILLDLENAYNKGSEIDIVKNKYTGKIEVECTTDIEN